ncbi:hypothetical protein BDR03DRAFT_961641 [Suillus americanus]|nr:hypothetical protein BDR03DRAFT_961641 [Suillus americanus]
MSLLKLSKAQSCTTLFAFSVYVGGIVLVCAESLFFQRVSAVVGRRWLMTCCNVVVSQSFVREMFRQ